MDLVKYSLLHREFYNKREVLIEVRELLSNLETDIGMVEELSRQKGKASIYRVPEFMREVHPKAYEPQLVSFGPYHHGKTRLLPMEWIKKERFFNFKAKYNLEFESIVESVGIIFEHLLGSYDKLEDEGKQNPAIFLKLLIVDGCFMLDFFDECPRSLNSLSSDIKRDMLLLENQLPMKLLQRLYTLAHKDEIGVCRLCHVEGLQIQVQILWQVDIENLRSLICQSMLIESEVALPTGSDQLHILEMYRMSLLCPQIERTDCRDQMPITYDQSNPKCRIIPHATLLREAGIKFRTSDSCSLSDVSFDRKRGILKLPLLQLDNYIETILLNVMAFEKLHMDAGSQVASYVILMDNLIKVDRDVALLESDHILSNGLGTHQIVVDLFRSLGLGAAMDLDSHITRVHYEVNEYCKRSWNIWWENLTPEYLQHKWALISVLAASFGFAIIILQVAYQIADYNRRN